VLRKRLFALLVSATLIVAAFAAPARTANAQQPSAPDKVILDTDIGDDVDDAFALALLLASPRVELLGVTTAWGDTDLRARLVARFLADSGHSDIPVAAGPAPPTTSGDVTKDQCVDANTKAQSLRRSRKLVAARAQLAICADPRCPAMVRDDCTQRVDELEKVQPTIVFDAKDGAGNDLSDVRVSMDGKPFVGKLDGTALAVDPGPHAFTFEVTGQPIVTRGFVLKEGEKLRRERIVIGPHS